MARLHPFSMPDARCYFIDIFPFWLGFVDSLRVSRNIIKRFSLFPLLGFSFISTLEMCLCIPARHNRKSKISKRSSRNENWGGDLCLLINIWAPLWFASNSFQLQGSGRSDRKKIVRHRQHNRPPRKKSWNILLRSNWFIIMAYRGMKLIKSEMPHHGSAHSRIQLASQSWMFHVHLFKSFNFISDASPSSPATFRKLIGALR